MREIRVLGARDPMPSTIGHLRSFGVLVLTCASLIVLGAGQAQGQLRSGLSVAQSLEVDDFTGQGQPGCGGATGGNGLVAALNEAFGTGFNDRNVAIENRRGLYRACDFLTPVTANNWTGEAVATPEQAVIQAIEFAPEELFAGMDDARSSYDIQTSNVARRLAVIRLARRHQARANELYAARRPASPQTSALGSTDRGPSELGQADRAEQVLLALQEGINAGDGTNDSGLGFFLNGRVHVIKGDANEAERGSEGTGGGFTLGADQRIGDSAHAGLAFGYTRIATNYDGNGSETDLDAVTFSLYGAWYPSEQLYVDGSISTAWLGLDTTNQLILFDAGPPVNDLQGETDGVNFGFDVGVGYMIDVPAVEGLMIEPLARLNVLYTEIDGYVQKGKGSDASLDLRIGNQKTTSVTGTFGFRTEYPVSTKLGVLTPYFRAAYVHEFNKENDDISAALRVVPGSNFQLKANATDSHYGNFGLGVAAVLGQGLSQFVDYDVIGGHDNVTVHQITAGIRLEY